MNGQPILSLILCSRNDSHLGDSVGRLQTTLNHIGNIVERHDALSKTEVILTDWGSDIPLKEVLSLNDNIKKIVRFNYIGREVTKKFPTKFSEVHALNSAARIAIGKWIGRIDQDTLVGNLFMKWILDPSRESCKTAYFSTRRDMDELQSQACMKNTLDFIENHKHDIALNNSHASSHDYWKSAVGILLIPRESYCVLRGYDEMNIFTNHMEHEFCARLIRYCGMKDLSEILDRDFYHLYHPSKISPNDKRKSNLMLSDVKLMRIPLIANGKDWGLCANHKKVLITLPIRSIRVYLQKVKGIMRLRKMIPKNMKAPIRKIIIVTMFAFRYIRRKSRKLLRQIKKTVPPAHSYHFAILCVKRTVYADMSIVNVNSLHYLNPTHKISVYCDNLSYSYLKNRMSRFDYPELVSLVNKFPNEDRPWQYNKIETLIEASKKGEMLTDADGYWHGDPIIDPDKTTMLVIVNKIADRPNESLLVERLFRKPEWIEWNHYVSGFVYIPARFMNEKLAMDLREYNALIARDNLSFIPENQRDNIRRLSEELAISLALQNNVDTNEIRTLKKEDGPESRELLQSFYYGCIHQVNQ